MEFKRLNLNAGTKEEVVKPFISPRVMIIISPPKSGKSSVLTRYEKILTIDCDPNGGTFYINDAKSVTLAKSYNGKTSVTKFNDIYIPTGIYEIVMELAVANNMKDFHNLWKEWELKPNEANAKALKDLVGKMPYPIVSIDTLTSLTDLVMEAALCDYKAKFPKSVEAQKRTDIKSVDNYGGVSYIRSAYDNIKNFIEKYAAPFIIYTGHVKEKTSVSKKTGDMISSKDLDLYGSLTAIFTGKADAICTCYRDDTEGVFLDFKKVTDDDSKGSRPLYLKDKVVKVSDIFTILPDGSKSAYKTYLDEIYPDILS